MSEYSTSSAVRSLIRWYLMRSVVSFSNWWNTGPWVSVAEYSSTGTDTSPNVSTPDQIARAILGYCQEGQPLNPAGHEGISRDLRIGEPLTGEVASCGSTQDGSAAISRHPAGRRTPHRRSADPAA